MLSEPAVAYGNEQAEQLTVAVSGTGDTPTGTVTVSDGTTSVCAITLAAGTGSCVLTADEFGVGSLTLAAVYGGDGNFGPSSSPAAGLQVTGPSTAAPAATTTTLELASASTTYGDEQTEKLSVTVATDDSGGAVPAGAVTVRSGTVSLCQISLSSAGAGSCPPKALALPPGRAELTASYAGDTAFGSSASGAEVLTVAREPSTTTISLSAAKVSYGAEQRERISATVRPAHGGTPAGQVRIEAGSATVCVITLGSARGRCSPASTRLTAGRHRLTAVYGGSGDLIPSMSAAKALSVARAPSRTALSLSATKVRYGSEGSATISVRVAPRYAGRPGGRVTVKAGGTTLAVLNLASGEGSYTLPDKRLAVGTYRLAAIYRGNADFRDSVSANRFLTVTSPPPPPPACYPRTSGGNCYEPGEYCPDRDHGRTGIAGDGEAIICENNDGWRWEPYDAARPALPQPFVHLLFMLRSASIRTLVT